MKLPGYIFTLMMALSTVAEAQNIYERYFIAGWDVNAPLNKAPLARDAFVNKISGRGLFFGFRQKITDDFFLGLDVNHTTYHDYSPRRTYEIENGSLTTDFFKYVYSYGVTLAGDYIFYPDRKFTPFAGLGVGANYNVYKMFYNVYTDSDKSWGLLIRPQAGFMAKIGKNSSWGLLAAIHFDFSSAKSDIFNTDKFTNIGFRLGFIFMD